jgi:predicted Zn-dependent protease
MRLFRAAAAGTLCAALAAGSALGQGLLRDEEIEHMLRVYADPIFVAAELEPHAVTIYLVGDPTMNAFVAGGQNIFIHTGIIVEAEEPIELKGVLAHETGHITGAHLARSGDLSRAAMGPFLATMAAGLAAAVAGHGDAAASLLMQSQYFGTLAAFTYSRGQEARADLAAVQFLEDSRQSTRGLIAFFDRFREQELFSEQRRYPYFRTHPMSSDRVSVLRERLEQQVYKDVVDPPEHILMLERAKAKIRGFLDNPQTTFRRLPETDQSTEAIYARSIAHYRAGSLGLAIEGIDELISREPENPYFWELKGQVFYEHGQPASAIAPYERAVELMPGSALFKIGLAQSLVDIEDDSRLPQAMSLLVAALAIEPGNPGAWYHRSRIHERRGERALALLSTAERHYYSGDVRRSYQFASRARDDLERGSPEWIRATDIVSTIAAANNIDPGEIGDD